MKKSLLFGLAFSFASVANAYLCLPGYHFSENYVHESACEIIRAADKLIGKTYSEKCYKGLYFYYYCKKD